MKKWMKAQTILKRKAIDCTCPVVIVQSFFSPLRYFFARLSSVTIIFNQCTFQRYLIIRMQCKWIHTCIKYAWLNQWGEWVQAIAAGFWTLHSIQINISLSRRFFSLIRARKCSMCLHLCLCAMILFKGSVIKPAKPLIACLWCALMN